MFCARILSSAVWDKEGGMKLLRAQDSCRCHQEVSRSSLSAFQPVTLHLFLPLLSHWSISTLLSHSLFHSSRPLTFISAKRFITAGCDLTPPPAFATVQKIVRAFFVLFFLCKAVRCPALRGPWRNVTHGCDHTVWSQFLSLGLSMLKCSDARPRRSFKSTIILLYFTNHPAVTCHTYSYELKMFSLKFSIIGNHQKNNRDVYVRRKLNVAWWLVGFMSLWAFCLLFTSIYAGKQWPAYKSYAKSLIITKYDFEQCFKLHVYTVNRSAH